MDIKHTPDCATCAACWDRDYAYTRPYVSILRFCQENRAHDTNTEPFKYAVNRAIIGTQHDGTVAAWADMVDEGCDMLANFHRDLVTCAFNSMEVTAATRQKELEVPVKKIQFWYKNITQHNPLYPRANAYLLKQLAKLHEE